MAEGIPFQLFLLPFVALQNAIRQFEWIDVFNLSVCYKNIHRRLASFKNFTCCSIEINIIKNSYRLCANNIILLCFVQDFDSLKPSSQSPPMSNWYLNGMNLRVQKINYTVKHQIDAVEQLERMKDALQHLFSVFKCTVKEVSLDLQAVPEDVINTIIRMFDNIGLSDENCSSLSIHTEKSLPVELYQLIFSKFAKTSEQLILNHNGVQLPSFQPLPNQIILFSPKQLHLADGSWIPHDKLFSMIDCEDVWIQESNFSHEECLALIHTWLKSDDSRLKFLNISCKFDGPIDFGELQAIPWEDEDRKWRMHQISWELINVSSGHQIERQDGQSVAIVKDGRELYFFVGGFNGHDVILDDKCRGVRGLPEERNHEHVEDEEEEDEEEEEEVDEKEEDEEEEEEEEEDDGVNDVMHDEDVVNE